MTSNIPTSHVSFVESSHGRLRREQRGIGKKDLQAAKKYGTRVRGRHRPNGDPTSVYTYNGIVYVTNDATGEEVTSYAKPIVLDEISVTDILQNEHDDAVREIQNNTTSWKSNTIIVVDTSGSMRNSDVWGAKTRLDAVWISLALDFIAQRIESGSAGAFDVVSVVSLGTTSTIVLKEQPTTWVLYNKIIQFYTEKSLPSCGHGNYIPSLEVAEHLLKKNCNSSCAMGMLFLSDGKPSDHVGVGKKCSHEQIIGKVEDISKRFGRRLTFTAIGIGSSDDFYTLQEMVSAASDFGVQASFELPSRTSSSIGNAFSTVATSVTSNQTELTHIGTLRQREVRNVLRESRKNAATRITHITEEDFYIYESEKIHRKVYHEWVEGCQRKREYKEAPLQHPDARFVAFSKTAFGEGAERFAYRFYELKRDSRTIVGSPMVAKESRYVIEHGQKNRKEFVKTFCETQQFSRRIAMEFNAKLDASNVDERTPRVDVLDCSIYYIDDENLGELATLVEPRIDHDKWVKWNSNNGFVKGMKAAPMLSEDVLQNAGDLMKKMDLTAIEECSEDEDDSDIKTSNDNSNSFSAFTPFTQFEVAQAFSHFSYFATGRKRLICDLQGVYNEYSNTIMLSDPVIHYYNHSNEDRKHVHGMTDRGYKGITMFFATHKCNGLCRMMTNGFKKPRSGRKHSCSQLFITSLRKRQRNI